MAFSVLATKKGGVPLQVQKRKYGKQVTLLPLASVRGDAALLLSESKKSTQSILVRLRSRV